MLDKTKGCLYNQLIFPMKRFIRTSGECFIGAAVNQSLRREPMKKAKNTAVPVPKKNLWKEVVKHREFYLLLLPR